MENKVIGPTPEIPIPNLTDSQKVNIEILKNLTLLNVAINAIQTKQVEDTQILDTLDKILIRGNGELPLRESVRNHESFIKEIRYWIKFIFAAVITQSIGIVGATILLLVRLIPLVEKLSSTQ